MKTLGIILACFVVISANCRRSNDECHKEITFRNQSNQTVHFCLKWRSSQDYDLCGLKSISGVLGPGSEWEDERRDCWEYLIELEPYERFVVEAQQFSPQFVPCDSLEYYYNILHQYSISLSEMKTNQFIVNYP